MLVAGENQNFDGMFCRRAEQTGGLDLLVAASAGWIPPPTAFWKQKQLKTITCTSGGAGISSSSI